MSGDRLQDHPPGEGSPPSSVELLRVRAPLRRAHRSAHGEQESRESILVGWHPPPGRSPGGGIVGWGECPTLDAGGYATETTEQAWSALLDELVPAALSGRSPSPLGAPAASAALADARLDSLLRARGVGLARHLGSLLGVSTSPSVPWCAVVAGVGLPADELVAEARDAVGLGASMVKVKITGAGDPRSVLAAVIEVLEVPVAADANGSLDARGASALDDLGLAYLEQPLPATTPWPELADLRGSLSTPVALDESLPSIDAVHSALLAGAADVVSVKPARLGGCASAARAASLAAGAGLGCFVGGMFELGIGRAAALGVASLDLFDLPTDLGPTRRYFARDVCEPLVTAADGAMLVPEGPGTGREPEVVATAVVERVVVSS